MSEEGKVAQAARTCQRSQGEPRCGGQARTRPPGGTEQASIPLMPFTTMQGWLPRAGSRLSSVWLALLLVLHGAAPMAQPLSSAEKRPLLVALAADSGSTLRPPAPSVSSLRPGPRHVRSPARRIEPPSRILRRRSCPLRLRCLMSAPPRRRASTPRHASDPKQDVPSRRARRRRSHDLAPLLSGARHHSARRAVPTVQPLPNPETKHS